MSDENAKFHGFQSLTSRAIFPIMQVVNRLLQSDITKTILFFTLAVIGAAAASPWLFNAGKMVAEVAETRHLNVVMNWLAHRFADADFQEYFNYALLICGLILAGPFIMWLNLANTPQTSLFRPWRLRIPEHSNARDFGQPLQKKSRAWLHLTTGFLLAASLLTLMVWLLLVIDIFQLKHSVNWITIITQSLGLAVLMAVIFELLFRGVVLGIFLRDLRPGVAITATSFISASLLFIITQGQVVIENGGQAGAGFHLLGDTWQQLISLQNPTLEFCSFLALALILSYCRYRTASLWLPIGLHAGWLFGHLVFLKTTEHRESHMELIDLLITADRLSGLLPICILVVISLLAHTFVQLLDTRRARQT